MKFQNTFFSLLRHAITTIGGALVVSPEPQTKAIGIVLMALGGLWGSADEYKAENPTSPLNVPPAAMLMLCALLGAGLSFGVSGCATAPGAVGNPALQEQAAYTGTKTAVLLVLQNEPKAEVALVALADGIDAVFTSGKLSPEQLKMALDALKVSPKSQLLIASAINDAYGLYTAATGQQVIVVTDPTATAILKGVKRGITEGIAFAHTFAAPPAS